MSSETIRVNSVFDFIVIVSRTLINKINSFDMKQFIYAHYYEKIFSSSFIPVFILQRNQLLLINRNDSIGIEYLDMKKCYTN